MTRSLPSYFRTVWPPLWLFVLFGVVWGMFEGGIWLIEALTRSVGETIPADPELLNMRTGILAITAVGYAAYRLMRFHPACDQHYAAWLKLSPWTADKPLPLGPVHLVWQDVVVVVALTAIAFWRAVIDPWLPAVAFGAAYLLGMTFLLAYTRVWNSCLLLGLLWPALALPALQGWPIAILVAWLVAVIWHGHRTSLRTFPWGRPSARPNLATKSSGSQVELSIPGLSDGPQTKTPSSVGWPYRALTPKFEAPSIPALGSLLMSLLVAWWVLCAILRCELPSAPALIFLLAVCAAMIRLLIYCAGLSPAYTLRGRIALGRILVPGFDKVFLTPLGAVAVAALGGILIRFSGSWHPLAESFVIGLVCFVLLNGGPTLRNWLLTGLHRYHPPPRLNSNKVLVRSI